MSIERITKRIIEEANNRAQEILESYNQKIKEAQNAFDNLAQRLQAETEKRINAEVTRLYELTIGQAKLETKKNLLKAKWEVIDSLFSEAQKRILGDKSYSSWIKEIITRNASIENNQVEILLNANDKKNLTASLTDWKIGKPVPISGGVIIGQGKLEKNFSLDAILARIKEELLIDLAKALFF